MKKILSLGVAAAVLSLTAVAASAAIAPKPIEAAPAGGSIVVEVVATGLAEADTFATFKVVASENLTLTDSAANAIGLFNPDNMMFTFASATAPAEGTVLLTLTFDVAADAEGNEVSVALEKVEGNVDPTAVTAVAAAAESDITDETFETVETIETVDTVDVPTIVASEESDESAESTDPNGEQNPPTGIALAVVPALVAGAAVVASKKRK